MLEAGPSSGSAASASTPREPEGHAPDLRPVGTSGAGGLLLGVAEADRRYTRPHPAASNKRLAMCMNGHPCHDPPDIVSGAEWIATVRRTLEEHEGSWMHCLMQQDRRSGIAANHLSERFLIPLCAV